MNSGGKRTRKLRREDRQHAETGKLRTIKAQAKAAAAFKGAGKTPNRGGSDDRGGRKHPNDKNAEKKQAKPAQQDNN